MAGTGLGCPHPGCSHPAAPPQPPGLPPPAKGPPGPPRQEWLAPHRLGQLGKILPRELDHVAHPQDGAEGGSVGVEAAGLHISGCQVGEEVPPGEWRGVEAWVSLQRQPSGCSRPHLRPGAFPMAHTAALLHEGGWPYPRLLCCALHVDTHPGGAELGHHWRGLPQGKRDTPPTRGLEVVRKGPCLLRRHPPFQAQSPLSLPPPPTAQQSPHVGPQPRRRRLAEKLVPESTLGRSPPGERGRRAVPSRGWGGGCNGLWLQEGARTQPFGP